MNKSNIEAGQPEQVTVNEQKADVIPSAQVSANARVMRRFYWLRRFHFARKKIGGEWMKTKWRGWITYQTFVDYMAYGFDPVALMSEQDGEVKWGAPLEWLEQMLNYEQSAYSNAHSCLEAQMHEYNEDCISTVIKLIKESQINEAKLDVMRLLPGGDDINEAADDYGFRVPYDGSNNFYDEVAIKHFLAGVRFVEKHFEEELKRNGA